MPLPVMIDTDIGDDIDDTWALVMALNSPELDVRYILTCGPGHHQGRAALTRPQPSPNPRVLWPWSTKPATTLFVCEFILSVQAGSCCQVETTSLA